MSFVADSSFQDTCFVGVFNKKFFYKKAYALLYRFIWCLSWARTVRKKLFNGIEHGGAKMVDIEKYFFNMKAKYFFG